MSCLREDRGGTGRGRASYSAKKQAWGLPKLLRNHLGYAKILGMPKTPTYLLLESRLGQDLRRHVMREWRKGTSWNLLSQDLYARTGISVTSETLRLWFHDLKPHLRKTA